MEGEGGVGASESESRQRHVGKEPGGARAIRCGF